MRSGYALLALLMITVGPMLACQAEEAGTPEQVAGAFLAAHKSGDAAEKKKLAALRHPDPWRTIEVLRYRGEGSAAIGLAALVPPAPDKDALRRYAAQASDLRGGSARVETLQATRAALQAKDFEWVLKKTKTADDAAEVSAILLLEERGLALRSLRRMGESSSVFRAAAQRGEALGWLTGAARARQQEGTSAYLGNDLPAAKAAFEHRAALEERRLNQLGVIEALGNLGVIALRTGHPDEARDCHRRCLAVARELGDRKLEWRALINMGIIDRQQADNPASLANLRQALKISAALGEPSTTATTLVNLGNTLEASGLYREARSTLERAVDMKRTLGDARGLARALTGVGHVLQRIGDFAGALRIYREALKLTKGAGDAAGYMRALGNVGLAYQNLGRYAEALNHNDQALELARRFNDARTELTALANLSALYRILGDSVAALERQQEALAAAMKLGDRRLLAQSHAKRAELLVMEGRFDEAQQAYAKTRSALEELEDASALTSLWMDLAGLHFHRGDPAGAVKAWQESLAIAEKAGLLGHVASARAGLGLALGRAGDHRAGIRTLTTALDQARKQRQQALVAKALASRAGLHLAAGDATRALKDARQGADLLLTATQGLADVHQASARSKDYDVYTVGVAAALKLGSKADVLWFMEMGRAAGLLQALGGRDQVMAAAVPLELRTEAAEAHEAEVRTATAYRSVRKGGRLKEVRAALTAHNTARARVERVSRRIESEARTAADLLRPRVRDMPALRAALEPQEALVLFGVFPTQGSFALVVTQAGDRIVDLGEPDKIEQAAQPLTELEQEAGVEKAAAHLRDLIVKPLKLPDAIRRVLICPAGILSYVPFALLLPEREVVFVPSGSVFTLQREERMPRGRRVLALGDPVYTEQSSRASGAYARGGIAARLSRLPATRAEVNAIGDVRLLGAQASEQSLHKALKQEERWRAIHFACHGLVDPVRPRFSSLALTPDPDNDGFLTVIEILGTSMPADLITLSACETARGRLYEAEGIVGLTRAFLCAGASTVLCSLWKVDDNATQALMVKFHELWKGADGAQALGAAAALQKAQAFVRSQPKWAHPYYWAAWVLWGLPQ